MLGACRAAVAEDVRRHISKLDYAHAERVKNFDEFHKKYGKYIIAAGGKN